jgi:hypothetical protein
MRSHLPGLACFAMVLAVTACSSSSSPSSSSSSSSATGSSSTSATAPSSSGAASSAAAEPTSGSGAVTAIKNNWVTFFSGKTSAAQKIALLQNGEVFASVINNQAGSSLASSATATVSGVTLGSGGTATVKYSVGVSGASLPPTNGTAVYDNGVWKVGDVSFCYLLTLENGGTKPAVCSSAG